MMQRGLDGRRVGVAGGGERALEDALRGAGAQVERLSPGSGSDADWRGARYSAVVVGGASEDPRVLQLVREALVSGKPIVVLGDGLAVIERAGGARDDVVCVDAGTEGVPRAVAALADRLEEDQVDEMSDLSFPASDPPAVTPASIGPASPERDARR